MTWNPKGDLCTESGPSAKSSLTGPSSTPPACTETWAEFWATACRRLPTSNWLRLPRHVRTRNWIRHRGSSLHRLDDVLYFCTLSKMARQNVMDAAGETT